MKPSAKLSLEKLPYFLLCQLAKQRFARFYNQINQFLLLFLQKKYFFLYRILGYQFKNMHHLFLTYAVGGPVADPPPPGSTTDQNVSRYRPR